MGDRIARNCGECGRGLRSGEGKGRSIRVVWLLLQCTRGKPMPQLVFCHTVCRDEEQVQRAQSRRT